MQRGKNRKFDSCAWTAATFVFAHVQRKLSYYSSVARRGTEYQLMLLVLVRRVDLNLALNWMTWANFIDIDI